MNNAVVLERLPLLPGATEQDTGKYQRRRVYIFLTRQGGMFCFMLMTMLVGAVNYNNSMAYILSFLLSSLFMICILHTYCNLRGLIIGMPECKPVHAGDRLQIPVLFENRIATYRIGIRLEYAPERAQQLALPPASCPDPLLLDFTKEGLQSAYITTTPMPRGVFHPGRFRISSTFPLGLFIAWSYIDIDRECVVYPEPAGSMQLPEQSGDQSQEQPGTQAGSEDFTGHRAYHSLDPVRMVDWKKYAAGQGLLVKRFSGSGAGKLWFQWQSITDPHQTEQQLSQFCLWIMEADRRGLFYGLELPGLRIEMDRGSIHRHRCLHALAAHGSPASPA